MPALTVAQIKRLKAVKVVDAFSPITTVTIPLPRSFDAGQATKKGDEAAPPVFTISSASAVSGGGTPRSPKLLAIADDFQPAVGVYLLPGSTGSGKTVLTTGICMWCNTTAIPAGYLSTFEPRSGLVDRGNDRFKRSQLFLQDLTASIGNITTLKLIVIDSITLPMKAYAENFKFQATFSGGIQPSDRGFLDKLSDLADKTNTCIVGVVNTDSVPYALELAGSVEGVIKVVDIGSFKINDRTQFSSRRDKVIRLPDDVLRAAMQHNNITGEFRRGALANDSRAGIYVKSKNS